MKRLICIALCSCLEAQVPFDRLLHADTEPGNWLTYSRDLGGKRYSPLSEINRQNASHLRVKWAHPFPNDNNEVSPIVIDGVMHITGLNTAAALDARTGRNLWGWSRPIPTGYRPLASLLPAVVPRCLTTNCSSRFWTAFWWLLISRAVRNAGPSRCSIIGSATP